MGSSPILSVAEAYNLFILNISLQQLIFLNVGDHSPIQSVGEAYNLFILNISLKQVLLVGRIIS